MTQYSILPIFHHSGGQYEEKRKNESFEGNLEKKECQTIIEKIEGRKKVSHLIRGSFSCLHAIGWRFACLREAATAKAGRRVACA